jgi:hypothetical protein
LLYVNGVLDAVMTFQVLSHPSPRIKMTRHSSSTRTIS